MKTRILVVDDEPQYTSMLKAHLESDGYFVVAEENYEGHAVTAAREFGPDLILMDVMMPMLEGTEVAAMIRENEQLRNVPILFLTALVSQEDTPQGSYIDEGNTYVAKSLPIDRLMQCINDAVHDSRKAEGILKEKH